MFWYNAILMFKTIENEADKKGRRSHENHLGDRAVSGIGYYLEDGRSEHPALYRVIRGENIGKEGVRET